MTPKWIGTSWKMNKTRAEALAFARQLAQSEVLDDARIQAFVIPPFTVLREVADLLAGTPVIVGAQNMHWDDDGPWTGEISAPMLVDSGARLVELGHSERRAHFAETDRTVALKVAAALRHCLTPLICVGETANQKAAGAALDVLSAQVAGALSRLNGANARVMFAYEPVWAIGAGGTAADPAYANARQAEIKAAAARLLGAAPPCLYGGSVTTDNCAELIAQPDIDGLFIGRAAWQADGYIDILRRCAAALQDEREAR